MESPKKEKNTSGKMLMVWIPITLAVIIIIIIFIVYIYSKLANDSQGIPISSTSITPSDPIPKVTSGSTSVIKPSGYDYYEYTTFLGNDLLYRGDLSGNINELAAVCTSYGNGCAGFLTNGQLKSAAPSKQNWISTSGDSRIGLYLKRR